MKLHFFKKKIREKWVNELSDVVTDLNELLTILNLQFNNKCYQGIYAQELFSLRVPRTFISRMKQGDPRDPLLLQILPSNQEFIDNKNFLNSPLNEEKNIISPGLMQKYNNRALLLLKTSCAINCRYCFRRHFPYNLHSGNKKNWNTALQKIKKMKNLNEIILSGGDPLMAKDKELDWIIKKIGNIDHIKILRIHTRLPVVIPNRITKTLCQTFNESRLKILLVTHINHAKEINKEFQLKIEQLFLQSKITLLNQSVLLKGINDDAKILSNLSNKLFENNILPYYLHILDKVKGTSHFYVSKKEASKIFKQLLTMLSGFLVPKLVYEHQKMYSKVPVSLNILIT